MERPVKPGNDRVPCRLAIGYTVKVLLDIGREIIIHDGRELPLKKICHYHAYFLRHQFSFFRTDDFRLMRLRHLSATKRKVAYGFLYSVLVALYDIAAPRSKGCNGRSIGGRTADAEFLKFFDKGRLGIPVRSLRKLAFGRNSGSLKTVSHMHFRNYCIFIVLLLIILTFHIEFEKTVKQNFCRLNVEFLGATI